MKVKDNGSTVPTTDVAGISVGRHFFLQIQRRNANDPIYTFAVHKNDSASSMSDALQICESKVSCAGPAALVPVPTAFVPVRYASPHVPEFGLPRGASDCWFGETGIVVERGVREAALATACNWSDELWGRDAALVPFGLFEDSGGGGGQVTGVLAPPPSREEHALDGAADPRGARTTEASPRSCIDLFAGAGGLALGLGGAGYWHLALVERDARKVATLERNGFTQAVCADVGDVDYTQWRGAVDLLSGGPPCQPFSGGGLLLGEADARNGWEVTIAATAALRPRAVLFENVHGMLTGRFAGYRRAISARLDDLGYHHSWVPLDAADFGVPQRRRRVFLIGFADRRARVADGRACVADGRARVADGRARVTDRCARVADGRACFTDRCARVPD